ncbi:MAG: GNAT family N-acetyltransferase [Caulobacteraceae bacterium]|nr:GNAT family N-acetyltransferase [Caulobacteraceae bacterium]
MGAPATDNPVVDNRAQGRFELTEEGLTAFASYSRRAGALVIPHVEAPVPLRGKGTAGRLMEGVARHARAEGVKIIPLCPYAAAWLKRHPEYADVAG